MEEEQLVDLTTDSEEIAEKLNDLGVSFKATPDNLRCYVLLAKGINPAKLEEAAREFGITCPLNMELIENRREQFKYIKKKQPIELANLEKNLNVIYDIEFLIPQEPQIIEYLNLIHNSDETITKDKKLILINAIAGNVVAKKIPAETIEANSKFEDIFGTILKCKIVEFRIDKGLVEKENGEIEAQISGQFDVKKDSIGVKERFKINNINDWSTGKLRFVGTVEVAENIIEHFDIEAGNSIIIGGSSETSNLKAGVEISVKEGIIGQLEAKIQAKQMIKAKYVNQIEAFCAHDCEFNAGCFHSEIFCHGTLFVENGAIVGGVNYAATGVRAKHIGGVSGVRTEVIAGYCKKIPLSLDIVIDEIYELKEVLKELSARLKPLIANKAILAKLSPRERENINKLKEDMKKKKNRLTVLINWLNDHDTTLCENARIFVNGCVYPGTIIRINNAVLEIKNEMKRMVFSYDPANMEILATQLKRR